MKNGFYVSSHDLFKEQFQEVDYGVLKQYVLIRGVRQKGYKVDMKKKDTTEHEKERREQLRIKGKIKELAMCNDFEYFYTQTLNDNRYDLDNFVDEIKKRFKAYKRKNENFIYLIIYEKHKDGAYHLHGLVGGLGIDVYKNKNGFLSLACLEDLGFNSLKKIGRTDIDKIKVSNYITKYITKDFLKTSTGFSYFHSKGLKTAKRKVFQPETFNHIIDYLELKYENDFIKIYEEKKIDEC